MSTPTEQLDLIVQQGANFQITHTWQDAQGSPIDLTGANVVMQIKASHEDATPLIEASTYNGYITLDPLNGKIIVDVPYTETAGLTFRVGVHDLIVVWAPDNVDRLVEGTVTLSPGVSLSWQTS